MPSATDQQNLLLLVRQSESLSASTKEMVFKNIANYSERQINDLTAILVKEKSRMSQIDSKYDAQETPLKEKYLEELKNFRHAGLREALGEWEKKEEAGKEKDLASLLEKIDAGKTAVKKGHFWLYFMIFIFGAGAAAAIFYVLNYGKII